MEFSLEFEPAAPPAVPRRTIRGCVALPAGRPPHPTVVIAHGYTSFYDWGFFPVLASRLAAAGLASVRFNFSGSGIGSDRQTMTEPEVFGRNSYLHELEDLQVVHAAIAGGRWPELDPDRMGIVGHSRGGAMALIHASEVACYRRVVLWAAIDRILNFSAERLAAWERDGHIDAMHWTARRRLPLAVATLHAAREHAARLDVLGAARRLAAPLLVVSGTRDRSVPVEAGQRLAAAAPNAELLEVDGDHAFGVSHPATVVPEALRAALDATVAWLAG